MEKNYDNPLLNLSVEAKRTILIFAFIGSQSITWKLVKMLFSQDKIPSFYPTLQVILFAFFVYVSVYSTSAYFAVEKFWDRHPHVRKFIRKTCYYIIVGFESSLSWVLCAINALFSSNREQARQSMIEFKESKARIIEDYYKTEDSVRGLKAVLFVLVIATTVLSYYNIQFMEDGWMDIVSFLISAYSLWVICEGLDK